MKKIFVMLLGIIYFYTVCAEQPCVIANQELFKVALIQKINELYEKALKGDLRVAIALIHFFNSLQQGSDTSYQGYNKASINGILWKAGLTDPEGRVEQVVKEVIQQYYMDAETHEPKIPVIKVDLKSKGSNFFSIRDFFMVLGGSLMAYVTRVV